MTGFFRSVLPRALGLGLALGLALRMLGLTPDLRISLLICLVFSVVMWGGFEVGKPFYAPRRTGRATREAMRSMARVSLLYAALLFLCAGIIRLATGIHLFRHAPVAAMTAAIGFAITSFMMASHTLVDLIEVEQAKARAEARAGLLALRAQLQPHTLFNALNTIAALIPEQPAQAEAATEALSRLLRRVIAALERESWSLAEEFSVLEDLLALERLRFGDRLRTTLTLGEGAGAVQVPPLLLLPLVENALRHGFRPKVGPCTLTLDARGREVRIEDDGVGRDPHAPDGVGLRTVRERLEAEGGRLDWPEVPAGCAVVVTL